MATGRKRIRAGALFALVIGILIVCNSYFMIHSEPELLEYMFSAGKVMASTSDAGEETFQSDLDDQLKTFTKMPMLLEGAATAVTLTGNAQSVRLVSEYGKAVMSPLVALGENAFDAFPRYLLNGRLFYPDELRQGASAMLVDEELALTLFQTINVEGRNVTLAEKTYRIIGVLRHNRRVGEAAEYSAYIPLTTAHLYGIQLDTITLSATPIQSAEATATFRHVVTELSPKGTIYDSNREKTGATFLARLVVCGFAFALLHNMLRCLAMSMKRFREDCTRRLKQAYISQILPFIAIKALWRFIAFAAIIAAAAAVFVLLVRPVYVFTDYIPSVLVEPEEIIKTFWSAQSKNASSIVYRTVSANRVEFFAGLSRWGSIMTLYGLLRIRRPEGI